MGRHLSHHPPNLVAPRLDCRSLRSLLRHFARPLLQRLRHRRRHLHPRRQMNRLVRRLVLRLHCFRYEIDFVQCLANLFKIELYRM